MLPRFRIVSLLCSLISSFLHSATNEAITVITISLFVFVTPSLACPLSCKCNNITVLEVSCQNGRLLNIFTQIDNTTYSLSLDHVIDLRLITKAHFQDLKASEIVILQITSSFVKEIAGNAFSELSHLEYLDLSGNELITIYDDTFAGLEFLTSLNLSHNQLSSLGLSLKVLPHLTMLDLSANNLKEIAGNAFSELSHLEYLDLSGNELITIYDDTFAGLEFLTSLNLSHNQLSSLGLSLKVLPHLTMLDLSANNLKDLAANVFGSQNTLTFLKMDGNSLGNLQSDIFEGVHSLRELSARDCSLVHIEHDIFLYLSALTVIDLGQNCLTSTPSLSVLSKVILRIVLLDHNEIKVLHQSIFEGVHLKTLDLSYNRINKIDPLAFVKTTLYNLDLSYNSLISLNRNALQPLGKQLIHLNLAGNPLHQLQTNVFEDLELLETLNLSSCSLDSLEHGHLQKLSLLRELDISHNNLYFLSQSILDLFSKLTAVRLHENMWVCDCHIQFLRDWIALSSSSSKIQCPSDHEQHRDCRQMLCSLPSNLQSTIIVQLKDKELGECLQEKTKTLPTSTQGVIVASCLVFAIVLLTVAIFLWRRGQTHHDLKRLCVPSVAESSHIVDEDSKVSPLANCNRNSLTLSDHNFVFRHYFDHLVTDPKLMADEGEENYDSEYEPTTRKERDSLYSSQPSLYSHHSDAGYGMESTV
ncbi:unnamed protein product [Candidula unifasciata]|uniref:LRRCT domain-containing protein n=1 Tax=Candidula unifasciata TaxID=100452 RepID=A0A8S3YCS2_9EUPU|nr:unnamed protein product [Candidula unifasciata]